jgi:hypothetical protein
MVSRTWVCFFLISFAALLWAAFLIGTNAMVWVGGLLITLVLGFMLILVFIELRNTGMVP